MTETPIDRAHAAMEAGGDADRVRFYDRLAEAELFVWLEREVEGDSIAPRLFPVEGVDHLVAFDHEARLAGFAGEAVPYAALSGRVVAGMLAGRNVGLALNLDAPSAILLPPAAMDWLAGALAEAPRQDDAVIASYETPRAVPPALIEALDAKLVTASGLAETAWLVGVGFETGASGHLLAFAGAVPGAEGALARAMAEALTFSGLEAGALDVAFLTPGDGRLARIEQVGIRIEIPRPAAPGRPVAPGSDPERPPKLR